jgi:protocatechuate 3,4-dioxygenase beta subunit
VPGGIVSGFVTDEDTGAGIRGAAITGYSHSEGVELFRELRASTADDGYYALGGLKAGEYSIQVSELVGYPRPNASSRVEILVNPPAETANVDFSFSKGMTISGIVVDSQGVPVGDARVEAAINLGRRFRAVSEADGTFTVMGLEAHTSYRLNAQKAGYGPGAAGPVELEAGHVSGIRIALSAPASIAGEVVNSAGEPVSDVIVMAQDQLRNLSVRAEPTGSDGAFLIPDLSGGTYQMLVGPAGGNYMRGSRENLDVRIENGEVLSGVRVLFDQPGKFTITGRVVDEAGNPIAGARIQVPHWPGPMGRSDQDGYYALSAEPMFGQADGALRSMEAVHPQYTRAVIEAVPMYATDADFVMVGRATIEGRVVDARTREALKEFSVWSRPASDSDYNDRNQRGRQISDANGVFVLEDVEIPEQLVFVSAVGYADVQQWIEGLEPNETVRDAVIALEPEGVIEGIVRDPSGAPLAGALVFVGGMPQDFQYQERRAYATSSTDGTFMIDALAPGDHLVSASHVKYAAAGVKVTLNRQSVTPVEIALHDGGVIEGTVTLDGAAVRGQLISIQYSNMSGRYFPGNDVATDETGYFFVDALQEGTATVAAQLHFGIRRTKSFDVEVESGVRSTVNFDFVSGTASIAGTIYRDDGRPAADANVRAVIGTGVGLDNLWAQVDRSGRYRFDQLIAGTVELTFYGEGIGEDRNVRVELADGEVLALDSLP